MIAALCVLAAATAAASSRAATELVVTGRGWGHGVGMSQWGADGYALHGWSWQRILAHYYPGTRLATAPDSTVRVLLAAGRPSASVGCAAPLRVADATGRWRPLPAGSYRIGPRLLLPVGRAIPSRAAQRHQRPIAHARVALHSPLVLDCPTQPLTWNGRAYHGLLVVRSRGRRLSAVNSLPLEEYVAGVVGGEMPSRWRLAALEAQAVAARSYALATLHPRAHFDLFSDTRSQVYGGIAYESPRTDLAVRRTAGRIVTWDGRVATTYFFSTSGGRTANVADVWPRLGAIPYLRSVPDPYDARSPHHVWGPIGLSAQRVARVLHAGVGDVGVVRTPSGRVASVQLGSASVGAAAFERAFGLQSTWFDVGVLSLASNRPQVVYGGKVALALRAAGVGAARLQRRVGAGTWRTLKTVRGAANVTVEPSAQTVYRLTGAGVRGPEVTVAVAPRLRIAAAGTSLLSGQVEPRSRGALTVYRYAAGTWRVVARPQVDTSGVFRSPLRLRAGAYRVVLAAAGGLASNAASLTVTPRLLASLRP